MQVLRLHCSQSVVSNFAQDDRVVAWLRKGNRESKSEYKNRSSACGKDDN
jgi:hypothetical protein